MGFCNSSVSFSRFHILDPVPQKLISEIPVKLQNFAFRDIDDLPENRSFGWVNFEDMLETNWNLLSPFKASYALFSLRLDTRRIPPSVIKKQVTLAVKNEIQGADKKFISKERKKEIKEQIILKLQSRFLPIPAEFNVVWLIEKNKVCFASVQTKMIDLFMEIFLNTFNLHLELLSPHSLATILLDEKNHDKLATLEASSFVRN